MMIKIVISLILIQTFFGSTIFWIILSRKNKTIDELKNNLYLVKKDAKDRWRTIMHYEKIMNKNDISYGPPKEDR